jgi:hypothetical protein
MSFLFSMAVLVPLMVRLLSPSSSYWPSSWLFSYHHTYYAWSPRLCKPLDPQIHGCVTLPCVLRSRGCVCVLQAVDQDGVENMALWPCARA